ATAARTASRSVRARRTSADVGPGRFPRAATMVCSFRCLLPRVCTRGTTTPGEGTRTRCRTPSQISLGELKSPGTEVQVRSAQHHPERLRVLAQIGRAHV